VNKPRFRIHRFPLHNAKMKHADSYILSLLSCVHFMQLCIKRCVLCKGSGHLC